MNADERNGLPPCPDTGRIVEDNTDARLLEAVALLHEALARLHGVAFGQGLVQISLRLPGQLLTVESRAVPPPDTAGNVVPPFSEEERQIVLALDTDEAPGAAVARRSGYMLTTRFRILLSNLTARGVLVSNSNGYRVADHRFVEVARAQGGKTP